MARVLVLGAGAIGQWLGGLLAWSGAEVTVLARPPHLEALRAKGIRIEGAPEDIPLRVLSSLEELSGETRDFDWLILAVKTFAVEAALAQARESGLEPTRVLTLQNGLGSEDLVAQAFGPERTFVGSVTRAVACPAPGVLRPGPRGGLALAPLVPRGQSGDLSERLEALGLPVTLLADSASMKWSKLLLNMVANASCAILDLTCRQLLADRALFGVEIRALLEALRVMEQSRIAVVDLPGYPVRALARAVRWLPEALAFPLLGRKMASGRGDKPPSLLLDLRAGRARTEVDWMNGAIAREASRLGLEAPVNRFLAHTLSALARRELSQETFRHRPEVFLERLAASALPAKGDAEGGRRSPEP